MMMNLKMIQDELMKKVGINVLLLKPKKLRKNT